MRRNSTLFFILDSAEGENEITDIDEILDPKGKYSLELQETFQSISFSPRNEIIEKILMNT